MENKELQPAVNDAETVLALAELKDEELEVVVGGINPIICGFGTNCCER